jgi:hypothetical protein
MMWLNKTIKSVAMLGVDLLLLLEAVLLSVFIASPVACIAWCFIDGFKVILPFRFWAFWLILLGICTVPMFIRIMVKAYYLSHDKKKKENEEK